MALRINVMDSKLVCLGVRVAGTSDDDFRRPQGELLCGKCSQRHRSMIWAVFRDSGPTWVALSIRGRILQGPKKDHRLPGDPSIQIIPTLGPKVHDYHLHWATWIPRVR